MRSKSILVTHVSRVAAAARSSAVLVTFACVQVAHGAVPALTSLPPWAQVQTSPTKRALVIGIGDYLHVPPLKTPIFDASMVVAALSALDPNFIITRVPSTETTRGQLLDAISAFTSTLTPGDVAFVYFSGHGLERDGVNYLVPINAAVATPGREGFEYLSLTYVLEQIQEAKPGISVVILDACRADPFAGANTQDDELPPPAPSAAQNPAASGVAVAVTDRPQSGATAEVPAALVAGESHAPARATGLKEIDSPDGFLVAYAAEPGKPSYSLFQGDSPDKGSIFTRRLVNFLSTVNKPLFNVFGATEGDVYRLTGKKQKPYLNSFNAGEVLLAKNFYLEENEKESWIRTVLETPADQQISALRGFLDLYPVGPFSSAARKRIDELEQGASPAVLVASVTAAPPVVVMSGALKTLGVSQAAANLAIASRDVFVRAAPRASSSGVLGTLRKGDEVQVLAAAVRPGWAKIALPNGGIGYVGSVATPSPSAVSNERTLQLAGDEVPDTVLRGLIAPQAQDTPKQPLLVAHISSGPAADPNPWRARQIAFLRALRIRAALVAEGATSSRITMTFGDRRIQTDTSIVTITRVSAP
jgi:uncharacterized caspase-like protein